MAPTRPALDCDMFQTVTKYDTMFPFTMSSTPKENM